jgi:regulatory protein
LSYREQVPFTRRPRRKSGEDDSTIPSVNIRTAALRLLGRREYTVFELRTRLTDRGYTDESVDALVVSFVAERLLDDRRVAAAHVRSASRIKRRGRLRIERELVARGLDRAVVHDALGALSADDDLEAIRQIVQRKRLPARPDLAERRRMFQHLLRRGFSSDAISRVLGRDRDDE